MTSQTYQVRAPVDAVLADIRFPAADSAVIDLDHLVATTLADEDSECSLADDDSAQSAWHPAVLRLVGVVGAAGRDCGKPVVARAHEVEPLLAAVLTGLGVTEIDCESAPLPAAGPVAPAGEPDRGAAAAALATGDALAARAAAARWLDQ